MTSNARAEEATGHGELIPGTELMSESGGVHEKNRVLVPRPSLDPHDPLNWSRKWKWATAMNMILYTYFSCWASLGIGSFTPILVEEFNVSLQQVSYLTSALILTLAYANFIIVPWASNYGRRPVFVISNIVCMAACIWQALAKSYGSFMAARIIDGLGAAANETLGPMLVADMFFLQDRGFWNGFYFFSLFCSCAMAPIIGGYIASSPLGWRWFFWLCCIVHGVLTITIFFFLPETKYIRDENDTLETSSGGSNIDEGTSEKVSDSVVENSDQAGIENQNSSGAMLRKGYPSNSQKYGLLPRKDPRTSNIRGIVTPITIFRYPIIIWGSFALAWSASCMLQINLLQGQVYGYAPYSWGSAAIGNTNWAITVGSVIGFFISGKYSDWVSDRATKRNGGIREPEMRLPALIPFVALLIVGAAVVSTGWTELWDWKVVVIVGFTCIGVELVSIPTIAITYAVDCYKPVAGELMVIATIVKNTWSFGLGFFINDLTAGSGYQAMWLTFGMTLFILSFAIPLYFKGKTVRRWSKDSWVHQHNL